MAPCPLPKNCWGTLRHAGIRGPRPHYCGSPQILRPPQGKGQAAGGSLRQAQDRLRLPAGKHTGILTEYQTKDKEKMKKKCFFLVIPAKLATI